MGNEPVWPMVVVVLLVWVVMFFMYAVISGIL